MGLIFDGERSNFRMTYPQRKYKYISLYIGHPSNRHELAQITRLIKGGLSASRFRVVLHGLGPGVLSVIKALKSRKDQRFELDIDGSHDCAREMLVGINASNLRLRGTIDWEVIHPEFGVGLEKLNISMGTLTAPLINTIAALPAITHLTIEHVFDKEEMVATLISRMPALREFTIDLEHEADLDLIVMALPRSIVCVHIRLQVKFDEEMVHALVESAVGRVTTPYLSYISVDSTDSHVCIYTPL